MASYTYLIVGNSAAAVAAIEAIRKIDAEGTIACVSGETTPAYSTPMISYLVKGSTTEEKMFIRKADFYENNKVTCLFGSAVRALDAENKTVTLEDGTALSYGKVLFTMGSTAFTPHIEGLGDQKNVFSFLTLGDAKGVIEIADKAMAEKTDKPVRAVVIGSGLIGMKAAEGLSYRVDEVVVLARSASILRSILDADASAILEKKLPAHGVTVLTDTSAASVDSKDGLVCGVTLDNGEYLACDLVVTAAGVRPNCALVVAAGAKENRGLVCDEQMQTSLADVYAAGDCAQSKDILDENEKILALWPNAIEQGTVAGTAMAGGTAAFKGSFAVNAIRLFDDSILTSGIVAPKDDAFEEHVIIENGTYTKFVTKDNLLYGFILMNRPKNAGIYTALIRDKTPLDSLNADIFDRSIEMRDFADDIRSEKLHKDLPQKKEVTE